MERQRRDKDLVGGEGGTRTSCRWKQGASDEPVGPRRQRRASCLYAGGRRRDQRH
jgi:hypothetical protein